MTITEIAWGPILQAAQRGEMPLLTTGCYPATVARLYGGRQPVYLATPYSLECRDMLGAWSYKRSAQCARVAARAAAALLRAGVTAVSPIVQAVAMVHSTGDFRAAHPGGVQFEPTIDPLDDVLFARWCQPILNACGAVVVPDLPGWDRSVGVYAEVRYALAHNTPVYVYADAPFDVEAA